MTEAKAIFEVIPFSESAKEKIPFMYTRILVPLDGSTMAEQVLAWVQILAKGLGSQVELLRVVEPAPQELSDVTHGVYAHQIEDNLRSSAQDYLKGLSDALRNNDISVATTARVGDPADCIASEAGREADTLIAMTTHGRSGIGRWLLGSVTDKVLHTTTAPLLMARAYDQEHPPEAVKFETIIVPLDGSSLAEQVLPHAESLAKALRLKVLLARAVPSLGEYHQYLEHHQMDGSATIYAGTYEEFAQEADARAMEYLHQIKEQLTRRRVFSVEEKLLRGHAADSITELAQEVPHSLVMMTTHGRSGIGRWLLGSVTDRVVHQSRDLVLVVRATEPEESAG
jgi:nucleotide-binding universal stress UspA family protein